MSKILLVSFIGYQEYLFFLLFFFYLVSEIFQRYITDIVNYINSIGNPRSDITSIANHYRR